MAFQPGSKKLQFSIKMGVDILDGRNSIAYKDVWNPNIKNGEILQHSIASPDFYEASNSIVNWSYLLPLSFLGYFASFLVKFDGCKRPCRIGYPWCFGSCHQQEDKNARNQHFNFWRKLRILCLSFVSRLQTKQTYSIIYIYILTFIYTSFPNHVFLTQFSLTWISTQPPPKKQHTQTHTSVSGKGPMVQFQSFQMQGFSIPKSSKATHLRGSCIGKTSFGRIFCFGFCGKKTWWEIIHLFEDVGECPNKI